MSELLTELRAEIDFEERFAQRAGFNEDEIAAHQRMQAARRRDVLRLELELEYDPDAKKWAPGPPVEREVERLDLAKARDLGVMHLLKSLKYTKFGPAIELEDKEAARTLLGKHYRLWGDGDDKPNGADGLPLSTNLEDATAEDLQAEALRLLGSDA